MRLLGLSSPPVGVELVVVQSLVRGLFQGYEHGLGRRSLPGSLSSSARGQRTAERTSVGRMGLTLLFAGRTEEDQALGVR